MARSLHSRDLAEISRARAEPVHRITGTADSASSSSAGDCTTKKRANEDTRTHEALTPKGRGDQSTLCWRGSDRGWRSKNPALGDRLRAEASPAGRVRRGAGGSALRRKGIYRGKEAQDRIGPTGRDSESRCHSSCGSGPGSRCSEHNQGTPSGQGHSHGSDRRNWSNPPPGLPGNGL